MNECGSPRVGRYHSLAGGPSITSSLFVARYFRYIETFISHHAYPSNMNMRNEWDCYSGNEKRGGKETLPPIQAIKPRYSRI